MNAVLMAFSLLWAFGFTWQNEEHPSLVAERGPSYSFRDGILELRSAEGWLRSRHLYLNFRVTFDFTQTTPESDAGVMIRTWGGWPNQGYRFRLPTDSATNASSVLVGHKKELTVVEVGTINLRPSDQWQEVEITGEGRRITMTLNGTLVGVFEVEEYGGYILFDNARGGVRLRDIRIVSTERDAEMSENLMTWKQGKDAGGQMPKLINDVGPNYTPDAMRDKVQGRVDMEVVVLPDGSTGAVRITRSLDPDLDLSAIAAVRKWKFTPGVLNGQPVSVLVEVEVTFRLEKEK